jgi:regulator of cell morphogenesis and NO signaling
MLIHKDMKMADVIHLNHHLLHVINRFGIQLGFGEKSVKQVCELHQVPLPFFLEIVNTFHDSTYFPVESMLQFKASELIEYLHQTHQYYLDFRIPEIENYIRRLTNDNSFDEEIKVLLLDFFRQYTHELTIHINKEEQRVYPYVLALEHYLQDNKLEKVLVEQLKAYSIHEYEEDHDDVESKLFDLKNILIKYIPQPKDSRILNLILHEIFELEKDLNNHAHIEDLILVPIVEKMELDFLTVSNQDKPL